LTIPVACNFIRQAALGLQHAFEKGMVHRDIKPSNLMVTPPGQVKILDFGLARLRSENTQGNALTQANAFMGTPEYVSPEQATDARSADTRADIYSLGCSLYYLLTGRPPFQEETLVQVVLAQLEKEPPALDSLRPDASPELCAVVTRMLAKDPAKRYQRPAEVAQALLPFVKPTSKPAAPAVPSPPPDAAKDPTPGMRVSRMGGLRSIAQLHLMLPRSRARTESPERRRQRGSRRSRTARSWFRVRYGIEIKLV
jgi:serine/threonine protein kinase